MVQRSNDVGHESFDDDEVTDGQNYEKEKMGSEEKECQPDGHSETLDSNSGVEKNGSFRKG
jgi:hypothetical protein